MNGASGHLTALLFGGVGEGARDDGVPGRLEPIAATEGAAPGALHREKAEKRDAAVPMEHSALRTRHVTVHIGERAVPSADATAYAWDSPVSRGGSAGSFDGDAVPARKRAEVCGGCAAVG